MINTNKLRGLIVERGKTQEDVARKLGVSPKTFYKRMRDGVFLSSEMDTMIDFLEIEDPVEIFFYQLSSLKSYRTER